MMRLAALLTLLDSAQAIEHGHIPAGMYVVTVLLLGGAFLPPAPRVAAFAAGIVTIVIAYGKEVGVIVVSRRSCELSE